MLSSLQNGKQSEQQSATEQSGKAQTQLHSKDIRKIEPIGKGAFGTVYKAYFRCTNSIVAVKTLNIGGPGGRLDELIKEIEILRKLDNPFIIKYYGAFIKNCVLHIITEFMDLGSVAELRKRTPLSELQIAYILRCVLKGLSYIHKGGMIHRDIKAANILHSRAGEVKLADFGVSVELKGSAELRKTLVGTPYCMAPEVLFQTGHDTKADIWSVGITAIELAEGHQPYISMSKSEFCNKLRYGPPPKLGPGFTPEFNSFVSSCLGMKRETRPTADELLNDPFIVSGDIASGGLNKLVFKGLGERPESGGQQQQSFSKYQFGSGFSNGSGSGSQSTGTGQKNAPKKCVQAPKTIEKEQPTQFVEVEEFSYDDKYDSYDSCSAKMRQNGDEFNGPGSQDALSSNGVNNNIVVIGPDLPEKSNEYFEYEGEDISDEAGIYSSSQKGMCSQGTQQMKSNNSTNTANNSLRSRESTSNWKFSNSSNVAPDSDYQEKDTKMFETPVKPKNLRNISTPGTRRRNRGAYETKASEGNNEMCDNEDGSTDEHLKRYDQQCDDGGVEDLEYEVDDDDDEDEDDEVVRTRGTHETRKRKRPSTKSISSKCANRCRIGTGRTGKTSRDCEGEVYDVEIDIESGSNLYETKFYDESTTSNLYDPKHNTKFSPLIATSSNENSKTDGYIQPDLSSNYIISSDNNSPSTGCRRGQGFGTSKEDRCALAGRDKSGQREEMLGIGRGRQQGQRSRIGRAHNISVIKLKYFEEGIKAIREYTSKEMRISLRKSLLEFVNDCPDPDIEFKILECMNRLVPLKKTLNNSELEVKKKDSQSFNRFLNELIDGNP